MDSEFRQDQGQALPLMLVALAVALVAGWAVASLGVAADDAARARTAADAAALAGAADGRVAASQLAAANGGVLVDYRRGGTRVDVVVRIGESVARASAEQVVEWVPSGGGDRSDE